MRNLDYIRNESEDSNAGNQPFALVTEKVKRSFAKWQNPNMLVPQFATGESEFNVKDVTVDLRDFSINPKDFLEASTNSEGQTTYRCSPDSLVTKTLQNTLQETYQKFGVVFITGNECIQSVEKMTAIRKLVIEESMDYQGGSNFRGKLHKNVYDTGAPASAHLHYHHEMAYVKQSPKNISFFCDAAPSGDRSNVGASYLSDNTKATYDILQTPFGQKLKSKGLCYIRKLPDLDFFQKNRDLDPSVVYNFWQTSFRTNDPAEAEAIAKMEKGLEVEWEDHPVFGRYMVTKYYTSAFEYCPETDSNHLFASVADDHLWFDTWKGLEDMHPDDRPLKLNFGDDEEMTDQEKRLFIDVYDRNGFPLHWTRGDILIFCNYRFAHGRPQYQLQGEERREIGVTLGNTFTRMGPHDDKW